MRCLHKCIDIESTFATQRGIESQEQKLAENDEHRWEAERQLVHLRGVGSAFEEIRSGLITKLQSFRPVATQSVVPGIER